MNDDGGIVVGFSGHRPKHLQPGAADWLKSDELPRIAERLQHHRQLTATISGVAQGCDLWWAQTAVSERIPLWAYPAFTGQHYEWSAVWTVKYNSVIKQAEKVVPAVPATPHTISEAAAAFYTRNHKIVADSDLLVAVLANDICDGGTYTTVTVAYDAQMPLVVCDPHRRTTKLLTFDQPDVALANG